MIVAVEYYVDVIGKGGGEEHGEQPHAISCEFTEKVEEKSAKKTVSKEMNCVGVQGEGGDEPIIFLILKDSFCISCAMRKPEGVFFPGSGNCKEQNQAAQQQQSWWLQ